MSLIRTVQHLSLIGALSLLIANAAHANKDLKENSPFLPPGYGSQQNTPPPPPPNSGPLAKQLEFKGLVNFGGTYRFSIFNRQTQRSYWLTKDQANKEGIRINTYNPETKTIVISMNGRSEQLSLMSASNAPLPVTASRPQTANSGSKPPSILPPGLPTNNNSNKRSVPQRRRVILPKKK